MTMDYYQKYRDLQLAVYKLYTSAYWSPDRPVDCNQIWKDVRDAAQIESGHASDILGLPQKSNICTQDRLYSELRESIRLIQSVKDAIGKLPYQDVNTNGLYLSYIDLSRYLEEQKFR